MNAALRKSFVVSTKARAVPGGQNYASPCCKAGPYGQSDLCRSRLRVGAGSDHDWEHLSQSSFSELDPVQAQDDSDDLNQLLAALQEPRAKMYAMAQHDKSMMPGIKRPDQMITMVKKHKAAPKRHAR